MRLDTRPVLALIAATATVLATGTSLLADLVPAWIARLPVGSSLSAGLGGMVVDPSGVTYVTGTSGSSGNNDITTAAYAADGSLLWAKVFDGVQQWHDQARGITLGPDGSVWVCGNTPGPTSRAKVLVLNYAATDGTLRRTIEYTSDPGYSEAGASIAVDAQGNIYVGGGTNGDGSDVFVLSFNPNGGLRWRKTWDGPAFGPYSQDHLQKIMLDPNGDLVAMIDGVMNSLHSDYVIIKYNPDTGATIWEKYWGLNGDDFPNNMEIGAGGDIFVSGTALALEGNNRYGTIRLRGSDGQLLWQDYSGRDYRNSQRGLAIDNAGGVYVTGSVDPDGDRSNSNDKFYTVKLDAATGAQQWSHLYGANCVGCFDAPGGIVGDSAGNIFLAGSTSSAPYSSDMILFVLDSATGLETTRGVIDGNANESVGAGILRLDALQNLLIGGGAYNVNTGARDITVTRYDSLAGNVYALAVQNLVGGGNATFTISGATPNRPQYIVYSLRGPGSTFVPQLNVTLDLASPSLLTSGRSNADGVFETSVHVPQAATGRTVWFQGAETGRTTAVIRGTVR